MNVIKKVGWQVSHIILWLSVLPHVYADSNPFGSFGDGSDPIQDSSTDAINTLKLLLVVGGGALCLYGIRSLMNALKTRDSDQHQNNTMDAFQGIIIPLVVTAAGMVLLGIGWKGVTSANVGS